MRQTIGENQKLQYKNVISTFYEVRLENLSQVFEEFLVSVFQAGYTADGPFFYCINSFPSLTGELLIQTFIPVAEAHEFDLPKDFIYQSYFQVLDLIGIRVKGEQEKLIHEAKGELLSYIARRRLPIRTPMFYLVAIGDDDSIYTDLLVGVRYNG